MLELNKEEMRKLMTTEAGQEFLMILLQHVMNEHWGPARTMLVSFHNSLEEKEAALRSTPKAKRSTNGK